MKNKKILSFFISLLLIFGVCFGATEYFSGKDEDKSKNKIESSLESNPYDEVAEADEENNIIESNESEKEEKNVVENNGDKEDSKKESNKQDNEKQVSERNTKDDTKGKNSNSSTSEKTNSENKDNSNSQKPNKNQSENKPNSSNDKNEETPKKNTCTISISCKTAINNGVNEQDGFKHLPSNGVILGNTTVEFNEGDTVYKVLQKTVLSKKIHMEYTGAGSSIYIEGIDNLYEFDGGQYSGWMYSVNGWYPNYGCGAYKVKAGDVIQWNYTCDLGEDLGQHWVE